MISINELWHSRDVHVWNDALARYWEFVKPGNQLLERELELLELATLKQMDAQAWYHFLLHKYFHWKFTAPNRYATTTKYLRRYADKGRLEYLHLIKHLLLTLDTSDVRQALAIKIDGLGIAGISGLLALMYPQTFATVDQFVVKALRGVRNLPEAAILQKMNEHALSINDGVLLIDIMQRKAAENNRIFGTTDWTPRKIDKVLWTFGR
jgi:hypothetical protein